MFGSALNDLKQVFARPAPSRPWDKKLFLAFFEAEDWPATTQLVDLYPDALFTDTAQAYA